MIPYIHRDISWLSFNYRVLQEAKDPSVPLFERLKFLAIYSSNLGEFYRVRVASHRTVLRAGKKAQKVLAFDSKEILRQIRNIVDEQQIEFNDIFENQIVPELKTHKINILRRLDLNAEQKAFVENYFNENLLPYVQPVLLKGSKIKPFLNDAALYLATHLKDKSGKKNKSEYAIVKIPSDHLSRFISLPANKEDHHDIIILDDIVRHSLQWIFPGYDIIDTYSIKLTRDAELYIDDEFTGDLIDKVKKSLVKRNVGPASRLVHDRDMPSHFINFLKVVFELNDEDLLAEGRYHNNFDFFGFPKFGMDHLCKRELPPLDIPELTQISSIFEAISDQDHFVNFPFHSYEPVIKFFEDAAKDPNVTHIKIVQYRVAKDSRIMKALMDAVKAGKQVSAFVEIKARFDEEANLKWGEKLEEAGVNVHYSMPGLKVHSKIALVRRFVAGKPKIYCYLSTGNFHEGTATLYTDTGLFTQDERITTEVTRVFSYIETKKLPATPFKYLGVGKFNLKQKLIALIRQEITNAKKGKKSGITLKMNSMQDKEMIELLYKASQAGVKIRLIVRGICSIVPGVPEISENIEAISIVDRFLEHSRIFIFENDGETDIYFSSADWMVRNLHHRIETMFPILDPKIKEQVLDIINVQWVDNTKARNIGYNITNTYRAPSNDFTVRSQLETYYYTKRLLEQKKRSIEAAEMDILEEPNT